LLIIASRGLDSSVVPEGPGIEFRWRRDFPHASRPALGPTQPLTGSLSRG